MQKYKKTGYLNTKFKIFHLVDNHRLSFDFHYHDFHKIIIHLQGNTTYCIEGRSYELRQNDIVFVNAGEVHRPVLNDDSTYERIIMYISKDYLSDFQQKENDLSLCFKQAAQNQSHVIRVPSFYNTKLGSVTRELEESLNDSQYANELYHEILFLEFMIQLNRAAINNTIEFISNTSKDIKIINIIDYLNQNLTTDISVDLIAENFYISRFHLMHTFKEATGYTIGNYITTKRLQLAQNLIANGMAINDACFACGFKNYSTFSRAYKKLFNCTPSENISTGVPPTY